MTVTYNKFPISILREWSKEKGLTFEYHPTDGTTFYADGQKVGFVENRDGLLEFIETYPQAGVTMYPCCNVDQGCKNLVAHPWDECPECFEKDGPELSVDESYAQEGTFHWMCKHGRRIDDCQACDPFIW